MADKETIIVMSKLASYDKYHSKKDRKKAEYFRHDYVYRQNVGIRFFTLLGSLIVILFYLAHRIIVDHVDILDFSGAIFTDLIYAGVFIILTQFFFSMLGFMIFSREYNEAQERIDEYYSNMNKLSRLLNKRGRHTKEAPAGRYEPDYDEYIED